MTLETRKLLVEKYHWRPSPERRRQARGLGQEVQKEPQVSVLVVNLVQFPEQILGTGLPPLHLGCGLEFALVTPHEAGELPATGTEQIHQREERRQQEQHQQPHSHDQDVEVKLHN